MPSPSNAKTITVSSNTPPRTGHRGRINKRQEVQEEERNSNMYNNLWVRRYISPRVVVVTTVPKWENLSCYKVVYLVWL